MAFVISETTGIIYGTYPDLSSAQTAATAFADAYALGKPDVTVQGAPNICVCVQTITTVNASPSGITYTAIMEHPERQWLIIQLTAP